MNVMGLFKYEDDFLSAARNLRTAGYDDLALMSPIPLHEAEEILGIGKSPVRLFSLAGALIGAVSGFTLAVATALVFILPTAGRAIITIPPYLIITYEMTILFGVLSTLLGFHVVSGLPAWKDAPYRPETNVDRFSVLVTVAAGGDLARVEKIIQDAGAEEVQRVADLS